MKSVIQLSVILFISTICLPLAAQEMPFVYDLENTGAECPSPFLSGFSDLPVLAALPDPFAWADGRGRVAHTSDWRWRRAEISAMLQHYQLGNKPPAPDSLTASLTGNRLTVTVVEGGKSLTLTAVITLPDCGTPPYPAVIGVGGGSGSLPADLFTGRCVATISYNFSEVAPWTQSGRGQGGFYTLYPDSRVGYFTAWAWGISRLIDGLQRLPEARIDTRRLAVTGCSFAGKIALYSGALDERIALTIAQEPGGGGDAAWRVTETLSGSRETLRNAQSYGWYHQDLNQFNNAVTRLPIDQHEVMALIAPRAFLLLGNPDMEWLAEESGYVSCMAARTIWQALGVPERFGFSKVGGHNHCNLPESQRPEVGAFIDRFLLGKEETPTDYAIHPGYTTNLASWIKWSTPELGSGASFFGRAALLDPPDQQTDLGAEVTCCWSRVEGAARYFFEMAADPLFAAIAVRDSTADTLITLTELPRGKRCYWRVRVRDNEGNIGPWSAPWSFTTYIPMPEGTQLVAATPLPNRADYINLIWRRAENATEYLVQLSALASFSRIISSAVTSDTSRNLNGTAEGTPYYWRVMPRNVAGTASWSATGEFTIIIAPTDLAVQLNSAFQAVLSWRDRSRVEEGYVVERQSGASGGFAVLGTLGSGATTWTDSTVQKGGSYTWRVRASKDSVTSEASNEVSLSLTSVPSREELSLEFSLSQNYPNPFNAETRITYSVKEPGQVTLAIYNLQGQRVRTLVASRLSPGRYSAIWDSRDDAGHDLPTGAYLYTLKTPGSELSKEMTLVR
jgi:hypothetical protein